MNSIIANVANRAAYFNRYARILRAMSVEDAKATLGFKPNESPSKSEINKAYRAKAIENHPDRGGDPEKMVEVNVAKDILEGKAKPSRNPPRPKSDPAMDPDEVKRRKEEAKRQVNIAATQINMERASRAMSRALSDLDTFVGSTWKADLKEFLVDDFAQAVDVIHDAASEGNKGDWAKAEKLTQNLSSSALRLASKYGSLKKRLAHVKDEATAEGVSALYKDLSKFASAFWAYRKESSNLVSLINTSEELPLVLVIEWDDIYSAQHRRIVAYDEDLQRFNDRELKFMEDEVEMCVDATMERLKGEYPDLGRRVTARFPDWKEWRIPEDFQDAIEMISKA